MKRTGFRRLLPGVAIGALASLISHMEANPQTGLASPLVTDVTGDTTSGGRTSASRSSITR